MSGRRDRRGGGGASGRSEPAWFESFFGEDYLEIYRAVLPAERTAAEVEGVVSLLGLAVGARVLDLACGHGRHAVPLAARGLAVVGFDRSAPFLARARADARAAGARVHWVRGDMRALPFADGGFDAVVNLFTAFGYFEDPADDLAVLRGVRRALRPGGRFLLETLHRDALPARFQPSASETLADGATVLRERTWDLARDVIDERLTLVRPDGTRRTYTTSLRMYSLRTLLDLLRAAGLEPEAWHGGLDGSPLGLESHRLAVVSVRPAYPSSTDGS